MLKQHSILHRNSRGGLRMAKAVDDKEAVNDTRLLTRRYVKQVGLRAVVKVIKNAAADTSAETLF
jgi:hypothetical protein